MIEETLDYVKEQYILHILNEVNGNKKKASEILGISPRTISMFLQGRALQSLKKRLLTKINKVKVTDKGGDVILVDDLLEIIESCWISLAYGLGQYPQDRERES